MKEKTIFALGFFDGVHLGHQALLKACRELAAAHSCNAGVITFDAHPDTLVLGTTPPLINSPETREAILKTQFHMDPVVTLPFDKAMMTMPWQDFVSLLRNTYGAAGFVCGDDFRFGHKGEGTAEILRQYCTAAGMPCAVIPGQTVDSIRVSSSHIRKLLESGETAQALRFLGHPHTLSGSVVSGRNLGRTIGVPTANLLIPDGVVTPKFGVYACMAVVDNRKYQAVTNVGKRPTVGGHRITVEPWLLDFEGDLYGKKLTLAFFKFLRPERKFSSLEELKAEILKNAEETRKFFSKT